MDDDPREVLALLNSLGFVGITAQQLKAFMKDLKLYRKIKDRERQQRKEEMKQKIIDKQQSMIKEILREQRTEFRMLENTVSTNSSSSYIDSSRVKVKVKCMSSEKENRKSSNSDESYTTTGQTFNMTKSAIKARRILDHHSLKPNNIAYEIDQDKYKRSESRSPECLKRDHIEKQNKIKIESKRSHKDKTPLQSARPMSAPNILNYQQDQVGSTQTKSTSSTKNTQSGSKSFIRPWRLQPEAQKSVKKSDPVALYQKYQQEWKQISFPGEAKHSSVRWAIREKMLGGDPHPVPLPKKSSSLPSLKRK